jgi:hypothetical protein
MQWAAIPRSGGEDVMTDEGRFKILTDDEKHLAIDTYFNITEIFFSFDDAAEWCERRAALDRDGSHDCGAMRPW